MTDFPILLYISTSETPTLLYTWSLKKIHLSDGASPYWPLWEEPPGYSNEPENFCFAKCCGITCNFQYSRDDCAILHMIINKLNFFVGRPQTISGHTVEPPFGRGQIIVFIISKYKCGWGRVGLYILGSTFEKRNTAIEQVLNRGSKKKNSIVFTNALQIR